MIKIFLREKIIIHFCMYTQFSCENWDWQSPLKKMEPAKACGSKLGQYLL